MPPRTFSGAFARSQGKGFFDDPLPTLHVANSRHFQSGHHDEPQEFTYSAPPAEAMGYDVRETWGSEYVVNTGGDPLSPDLEDENHFDGEGGTFVYTDLSDISDPGGADKDMLRRTLPKHARDTGAGRQLNFPRYRDLRFEHEHYKGDRFEGFGPEASEVTETALRRGLNADEQNNPPDESYGGRGFRFGWVEQFWVDRKLVGQGLNPRSQDVRLWTPNNAFTPANVAPPAKGNPYTTPFPSLARAIQILSQRPQLRRAPDPDELTMTAEEANDNTGVYAAHLSDWWEVA